MPYSIKSYVGGLGKLHVVWGVNVIDGNVYDALYYDGIDIKTGKWNEPLLLDKRPAIKGYFGPSVPSVVDNGKYVVIMYNGGNPFTGGTVPIGRPTILVRLSEDGGKTWGNVTAPLPFLTGQSAEQALVVDSRQVVHLIANMRIDSLIDGNYKSVDGVWHSEFREGIWGYPERFVATVPPANIRAVVSQGNVILATWMEDGGFGQNGVWYSYTSLDAPESPVASLPIQSTFEKDPLMKVTVTNAESIQSPTSVPGNLWDRKNTQIVGPQLPILIGIIPAVMLIVVIAVRAIFMRRK